MINFFFRRCFLALLLISSIGSYAQNLSFEDPVNIWPQFSTSNSVVVAKYQNQLQIAFVNSGDGVVYIGRLGGNQPRRLDSVVSHFAPQLIATPNKLYLLWIDPDGRIKYKYGNDVGLLADCYTKEVKFNKKYACNLGFAAEINGDKLLIIFLDQKKNKFCYSIARIKNNELINSALTALSIKSPDCPSIATISKNIIRMTWSSGKKEAYFMDYDLHLEKWTKATSITNIQSSISPSMIVKKNGEVFYVYPDSKNNAKLYYIPGSGQINNSAATQLPGAFKTLRVSSKTDDRFKQGSIAFTGTDNKIYISGFLSYNPAKWMEETFYPDKKKYSLKDIVLPGAHDAGMSVLTAAGGQQPGTINECNTLTQSKSIREQLNVGIRMFDLRIGSYNSKLYAKHCSADCMSDAIGGAYGESLRSILISVKEFLNKNTKETAILTFSHFCEKEASAANVAQFITDTLGKELMYMTNKKNLASVTLDDLAGKAIILFENYARADLKIDSASIAPSSNCFINFKREYASTNILRNLIIKEQAFFKDMMISKPRKNDMIRLDWQLTQSSEQAALVCNDFQDEKLNPIVNGVLFITKMMGNHQSIRNMAKQGNQTIAVVLNEWVRDGTINKDNKPNIVYVDAADNWVTDYCIQLNRQTIYQQ